MKMMRGFARTRRRALWILVTSLALCALSKSVATESLLPSAGSFFDESMWEATSAMEMPDDEPEHFGGIRGADETAGRTPQTQKQTQLLQSGDLLGIVSEYLEPQDVARLQVTSSNIQSAVLGVGKLWKQWAARFLANSPLRVWAPLLASTLDLADPKQSLRYYGCLLRSLPRSTTVRLVEPATVAQPPVDAPSPPVYMPHFPTSIRLPVRRLPAFAIVSFRMRLRRGSTTVWNAQRQPHLGRRSYRPRPMYNEVCDFRSGVEVLRFSCPMASEFRFNVNDDGHIRLSGGWAVAPSLGTQDSLWNPALPRLDELGVDEDGYTHVVYFVSAEQQVLIIGPNALAAHISAARSASDVKRIVLDPAQFLGPGAQQWRRRCQAPELANWLHKGTVTVGSNVRSYWNVRSRRGFPADTCNPARAGPPKAPYPAAALPRGSFVPLRSVFGPQWTSASPRELLARSASVHVRDVFLHHGFGDSALSFGSALQQRDSLEVSPVELFLVQALDVDRAAACIRNVAPDASSELESTSSPR